MLRPSSPPPFVPFRLPTDEALHSALLDRLYALPFDAFARCVCLLLARMGYVDVRPAGRGHYRGSNQHRKGVNRKNIPGASFRSNGYDLVADLPVPEGAAIRRFAVASLKQFPPQGRSNLANPARVFQRQVDEARGASLRAGASVALLITTGAVSPTVAHKDSLPLAPIAPVCVIDGDELARLCVRFGVGVVPEEDGRNREGSDVQTVLDAAFFDRLARSGTGNGPADFATTGVRGIEAETEKEQSEPKMNDLPAKEGGVPTLFDSAIPQLRNDSVSRLPLVTLSVRVSVMPDTNTWQGGSR